MGFAQASAASPWWERPDVLAYAVLEQGRCGAEALRRANRSPRDAALLEAVHGGLGMAGYAVSDHLDPSLRRGVAELARDHPPRELPPASTDRERLLLVALHAETLLARCLSDPDIGEQVHLGHLHALDALSAVSVLVGGSRSRALVTGASRAGQFSSQRQRELLAPLAIAVATA